MRLFRRTFHAALRCEARQLIVGRELTKEEASEHSSMLSICIDSNVLFRADLYAMGKLIALIFGQAQLDGATRVRLYYSIEKMIYTIEGVDYDLVPMPSPVNVDTARELAKLSKLTWDRAGSLRVRFKDHEVRLSVSHGGTMNEKYIEIVGFDGEPRPPGVDEG